MPQLFQDLITGDLARFSAMTILDRTNESLVIAEQKLSETGFYSDDGFSEFGNLTNAQYIVAGNIQNTGNGYTVTFRINKVATNEIRSSFTGRYGSEDITNGKAAKEVVRELLLGMGVELTDQGERLLFEEPYADIRGAHQLARGMAAEKSGNIVEALAFFSGALDADATKAEAGRHIQSFFGDIATANIQERINYALVQEAKMEENI
jgi:hypothetical protein